MPLEWGIYGVDMGHTPQVEKGRAKKFYNINWSFLGLFRCYLTHFKSNFRHIRFVEPFLKPLGIFRATDIQNLKFIYETFM